MMLRHSRWSGRHIMPTGPGWMAVDQTGGVAACLVWNNNEKSSGGQAQHVNDQQSLEGCEQVSDVSNCHPRQVMVPII